MKVGDVIFGIAAGGQEKLLLVYDADDEGFWARHVTSQTTARFGRDGDSLWVEGGGACTIVSTAKLPANTYKVVVGLDRKFAAKPEYPDTILSKAEIELLLTHGKFFRERLVPGTAPIVKAADKLNSVRKILQLEWDPVHESRNAPMWGEYLDYLPALVDLLDQQASVEEVAGLLEDIASRRKRSRQVEGRGLVAAASLVRLRQSWD